MGQAGISSWYEALFESSNPGEKCNLETQIKSDQRLWSAHLTHVGLVPRIMGQKSREPRRQRISMDKTMKNAKKCKPEDEP